MPVIVNGETIPDSLVEQAYLQLKSQQPELDLTIGDLREMVIDRTLLQQHARQEVPELPKGMFKNAMDTVINSQGGTDGFDAYLEEIGMARPIFEANLHLQMQVDEFVAGLMDEYPDPSDEELEEFFEENRELFHEEESVIVANIVKEVDNVLQLGVIEREMKEIRQKIKNEDDFFLVAQNYSDLGGEDGIAGPITRGLMLPEYEEIIFNLGPREISDAFYVGKSFFIVMLIEKLPARTPKFDEVVDEVEDAWLDELEEKVIGMVTAKLREVATIEYA